MGTRGHTRDDEFLAGILEEDEEEGEEEPLLFAYKRRQRSAITRPWVVCAFIAGYMLLILLVIFLHNRYLDNDPGEPSELAGAQGTA